MIITINGKEKTLNAPLNLEECLEQNGFADMKVAAALSGSFVPHTKHAQTTLKDGDQVEILAPMQGG